MFIRWRRIYRTHAVKSEIFISPRNFANASVNESMDIPYSSILTLTGRSVGFASDSLERRDFKHPVAAPASSRVSFFSRRKRAEFCRSERPVCLCTQEECPVTIGNAILVTIRYYDRRFAEARGKARVFQRKSMFQWSI